MTSSRFSREDWLVFGLAQLASTGPQALKLSVLCSAAHKTIGSFYHHFEDQDAYFGALLEFWKNKNTVSVIENLASLGGAKDKAAQLEIVAMAMDQTEDVGIRVLAHQNATAVQVVAEVDQLRIGFLKAIYEDQFNMPSKDAELLAKLEYAAFVGTQTIWPKAPLENGQALSGLFQRMVMALGDAEPPG